MGAVALYGCALCGRRHLVDSLLWAAALRGSPGGWRPPTPHRTDAVHGWRIGSRL